MLTAPGFGRGKEASYQATRSVLWVLSPVIPGTTQGLIFTRQFLNSASPDWGSHKHLLIFIPRVILSSQKETPLAGNIYIYTTEILLSPKLSETGNRSYF